MYERIKIESDVCQADNCVTFSVKVPLEHVGTPRMAVECAQTGLDDIFADYLSHFKEYDDE